MIVRINIFIIKIKNNINSTGRLKSIEFTNINTYI